MIAYSIIKKSQLEGALRIDAEYYQPECLDIEKQLLQTKACKAWGEIEGRFITGPFGSEFNVENYVKDGKYRYIRGKDVKDFFVLEDDNVYIPENDFERLKKYSLKAGDILISVVGTLGNVSIIDNSTLPAIFSCKSTAFRSNFINPYYFLSYINSKYGKSLLERSVRGTVQTGLNIEDLRNLHIYLPSREKQDSIGNFIKQSKNFIKESENLYQKAENLLLEELGLKDYKFYDDISCVVKLSEVKNAERIDAEYFQPKYKKIFNSIKKGIVFKSINDFCQVERGSLINPNFYDELEGNPYIRGKDFSSGEIENKSLIYINKNFKKATETIVNRGDIVFALIGSVGDTAIVEKEFNGSFISNNIGKISINDKNYLLPEYFIAVLHSIIGKSQFEKYLSRTAQPKISDSQIKEFLIPILPKNIQQKIADLVRKSHEARKKSKELLEEAKRKVEELIEGKK